MVVVVAVMVGVEPAAEAVVVVAASAARVLHSFLFFFLSPVIRSSCIVAKLSRRKDNLSLNPNPNLSRGHIRSHLEV